MSIVKVKNNTTLEKKYKKTTMEGTTPTNIDTRNSLFILAYNLIKATLFLFETTNFKLMNKYEVCPLSLIGIRKSM
jgi:hypothetical protein